MTSRIAKVPIKVPKGVSVSVNEQTITVKGSKAQLNAQIHPLVAVKYEDEMICVSPRNDDSVANMQAGTVRALINNMVIGVTEEFSIKLVLLGVGYRAQMQGKKLNLGLGFSEPRNYAVPAGITIETPSQTEIVIKGMDKQLVGQVAADIREYRPPEPYKGKGIRYADEKIILKEVKKK